MMRVATSIIALAVIAWVARAEAPIAPKRTQPVGFDHVAHDGRAPGVECATCHVLERGIAAKPPGHGACFTAACHPSTSTKLDKLEPERLRFCIACHAETALVLPADKKALAATKVTTGIEHGVQFGHNSHRKSACTACHDVRAGARPQRRPHDRCVGCHADKTDKTFAIGACAKCHPRGNDRPRFTDNQIVVTSAFSHARHATRGTAKQCATCHASLAASDA
jgi:hypothetical protein